LNVGHQLMGAFKKDPFTVFLQKYRTKRFAKGELILVQGEKPPFVYVIKKGVVKTYNLTTAGDEKPIDFDIQNEAFPLAWVFGQATVAPYYYEAFTDCEVYCLPRDEYRQFVQGNHEQLLAAFDRFVTDYLNLQLRVNALEQSKATAKIVHTIHYLCLRYGVDVRKHRVRIQIPFTQQDLANFMGLTRETTGIELKKLQKSGVLSHKYQHYYVQTDKLNDLLDEEYDLARLSHRQVRIRL